MFGLPFFDLGGGLGGGLGSFLPIYGVLFMINLVIKLVSGDLTDLFPTDTAA